VEEPMRFYGLIVESGTWATENGIAWHVLDCRHDRSGLVRPEMATAVATGVLMRNGGNFSLVSPPSLRCAGLPVH
jgi:hypothetical protein